MLLRDGPYLDPQDSSSFRDEFAQAIPAEWNATVGWAFTRHGYHQGARRLRQHARPAATWSILQPVAPVRHEASPPALHRRPTHALLLRQPTGPESGGTAQNDPRTPRQALWRGCRTSPTGQFPLLDCGQHDHRGASNHRDTYLLAPTLPGRKVGSPLRNDCVVSITIGTLAGCLLHVGALTFRGSPRLCPHCRRCSTRVRPRGD